MSEETPNLSFWVTPEKTIKNGCVKDDIFLSKFCLRIRARPAKGVKKRHLNSRRKFPLHKNWLQFTIESFFIPLILFRGLNVWSRCGEANFLGYIYDRCKYFSLNCWIYQITRRRVENANIPVNRDFPFQTFEIVVLLSFLWEFSYYLSKYQNLTVTVRLLRSLVTAMKKQGGIHLHSN